MSHQPSESWGQVTPHLLSLLFCKTTLAESDWVGWGASCLDAVIINCVFQGLKGVRANKVVY